MSWNRVRGFFFLRVEICFLRQDFLGFHEVLLRVEVKPVLNRVHFVFRVTLIGMVFVNDWFHVRHAFSPTVVNFPYAGRLARLSSLPV